jgi:hypothetical protein
MKPEDSGRMILITRQHLSPDGSPCRGSGRAIAVWPVRVEISAGGGGYQLRIGQGQAVACSSGEDLAARLRALGIEREEARRRVAAVEPGKPIVLDVPERRRQPRSRSND